MFFLLSTIILRSSLAGVECFYNGNGYLLFFFCLFLKILGIRLQYLTLFLISYFCLYLGLSLPRSVMFGIFTGSFFTFFLLGNPHYLFFRGLGLILHFFLRVFSNWFFRIQSVFFIFFVSWFFITTPGVAHCHLPALCGSFFLGSKPPPLGLWLVILI